VTSKSNVARSSQTWLLVAALIVGVAALIGLAVWGGTLSANRSAAQQTALSAPVLEADVTQFYYTWHDRDVIATYDAFDHHTQAALSKAGFTTVSGRCIPYPPKWIATSVTPLADGAVVVHAHVGRATNLSYWEFQNGQWRFNLARTLGHTTLCGVTL